MAREAFVHLHNHFFFDSGMRVEDGVARIAELGQPALAVTDHNSLALWPRFVRACRDHPVKPLLGLEAYFVDDAAQACAQHRNDRYHLILLAKNKAGVRSLIALQSASTAKYAVDSRVSLVDFNLLAEHREGLIATGACIFGRIPDALWRGRQEEAETTLRRYREIFGDDFYLEVADHFFPEQQMANRAILELGKAQGVKVLAVNDCHFARQPEWYLQRIVMKTLYGELTGYGIESQECYLKSRAEMEHLGFPAETYDETVRVAERIDDDCADALTPAGDTGTTVAAAGHLQVMDVADAVKAAGLVLHLPKAERARLTEELTGKSAAELAALPPLSNPILNFAIPRLVGIARGVEPDPQTLVTGAETLPCHVSGGMAYAHWDATELRQLGYAVEKAKDGTPAAQRAKRAQQLLEAERLWKSRAHGALLDLTVQMSDDGEGERDLYRALALQRLRQPDEAEKLFRGLLDRLDAKHPLRYEVHLQHAWNLFHLRKPFEVVAEEFDRAAALAPGNPAPHYAKGTLGYKQRKYGMARVALRRYLELATPGKQYAEVSDLLANLQE